MEKRERPHCAAALAPEANWQYLEFEVVTDLAFPTGQTLQCAPKRGRGSIQPLHGCDVALVEEVEEFEEHLGLHPLSNVESLGNPHVRVNEGRRRVKVAGELRKLTSEAQSLPVKQTVAVEIRPTVGWCFAVVKTTLRPEDSGE